MITVHWTKEKLEQVDAYAMGIPLAKKERVKSPFNEACFECAPSSTVAAWLGSEPLSPDVDAQRNPNGLLV
jgi:hypothetical protein